MTKTTPVKGIGAGKTTTPQVWAKKTISKTKMVQIINETKGRFFASTHIGKDGKPHTMNAMKSNKPSSELGYIMVYVPKLKSYRNINPQTLTDLRFQNVHYKARK